MSETQSETPRTHPSESRSETIPKDCENAVACTSDTPRTDCDDRNYPQPKYLQLIQFEGRTVGVIAPEDYEEIYEKSRTIERELTAAGAENNQFRDAKKLMSELDNDTQSELAAWELLRDCRAELTAALAEIHELKSRFTKLDEPKYSGAPMMDEVLKDRNPEFEAWVASLPATYWARYDLSASRIGWEFGRKESLAKIEQLETAGIHSCHDNCQRPNCVLRRENQALKAEIDMMGIRYAAAEMHHATNMQELTEQRDKYMVICDDYSQVTVPKLTEQRDRLAEALEAADECLALVEDTGHGCLGENITVARSIATKALAAVKGEKG